MTHKPCELTVCAVRREHCHECGDAWPCAGSVIERLTIERLNAAADVDSAAS